MAFEAQTLRAHFSNALRVTNVIAFNIFWKIYGRFMKPRNSLKQGISGSERNGPNAFAICDRVLSTSFSFARNHVFPVMTS